MNIGQYYSDTKCSSQASPQVSAGAIGENNSRPLLYSTIQPPSVESEKGKDKPGKNEVHVEIPLDRPGVGRPSQMLRIHHQMASGANPSMRDCREEKPSFFLTFSLLDDVLADNVNVSSAEDKCADSEVGDSETDDDLPALLDRDPSSSEDDMPPLTDRYSYSTDEEF